MFITEIEVKKYVCKKEFEIPEYDDNERIIENKNIRVELGSVWERVKTQGISDIRLEKGGAWLELPEGSLETHFKEL